MFTHLYKRATSYFASHPALNSAAHFAGGFGLAIILGDKYPDVMLFTSVNVGIALLAFSVFVHLRAFMKK